MLPVLACIIVRAVLLCWVLLVRACDNAACEDKSTSSAFDINININIKILEEKDEKLYKDHSKALGRTILDFGDEDVTSNASGYRVPDAVGT